uniref:sugar phosphate nucleotidyltransferase n=1 Tax=Candidatus Cryptobacteroides bacterium TaxID=3085639 RepID=UPI0040263566
MNKDNRYCVIMAGGTSNHFWPISREASPKQFLDIAYTGESFIKTTYDRFSRIVPPENIIVVSLARFADLVRKQIPDLPADNLLLEPYSRSTGPCLVYATYSIMKRNPDATVLATPPDHTIADESGFRDTILK